MNADPETAALLQKARGHFAPVHTALTQARGALTEAKPSLVAAVARITAGDRDAARQELAEAARTLEHFVASANRAVAATKARHAVEAALRSLAGFRDST